MNKVHLANFCGAGMSNNVVVVEDSTCIDCLQYYKHVTGKDEEYKEYLQKHIDKLIFDNDFKDLVDE